MDLVKPVKSVTGVTQERVFASYLRWGQREKPMPNRSRRRRGGRGTQLAAYLAAIRFTRVAKGRIEP
ncbi:MAG: hypothetical protein QOI10_1312 [Solirubrobacterales bacterium]|jgi:homospermidine synthase|nr:hypothetical protein [Solirubrobacterales bacterium]